MSFEDAPNLNHLWAGLLVEELVRNGVDFFCLSPGSRSTPLTVAVARNPGARHMMHYDERGAAFYALGRAKAAGRPAALVCTSGSAAANYWPAVVEAELSQVPLVILTADRPPELLHTGANQAIDQNRLFGLYVRWFVNLPPPTMETPPETVCTTAGQAVHFARRPPYGPVHINCMFREPLAPASAGDDFRDYLGPLRHWRQSDTPYTTWNPPVAGLSSEEERAVLEHVIRAERGLLVVGRLRTAFEVKTVRKMAEALGWPVVPDIASGLRLGDNGRYSLHHYEALLTAAEFRKRFRPDLVLHVGGRLVSKRLLEHIAEVQPAYLQVIDHPVRQDPHHRVTWRLELDVAEFATSLTGALAPMDGGAWGNELIAASEQAGAVIDAWLAQAPRLTEMAVARTVSRLRPAGSTVFLGNSMPVRDMNAWGAPDGPAGAEAANRGASGIDGNIATAAAYAEAREAPLTIIVGDLTALHDLNSLALLRDLPVPVALVVLNNDGGGIFSFLPIAKHEDIFEPYFGTPHGLNFEGATRMFGLRYARPDTGAAFAGAYETAIAQPGATLIEVVTDRRENLQDHRALQKAVANRLSIS